MDDESLAIEEGEALLLGILPLFTSTLGQVKSAKNSYFENFCTLLCAEAQLLETWLIEQDTRINTTSEYYLDILENILTLFERLVSPEVLHSSSHSSLVCTTLLDVQTQGRTSIQCAGLPFGKRNMKGTDFFLSALAVPHIRNSLPCASALNPRSAWSYLFSIFKGSSTLDRDRMNFERSSGSSRRTITI
jgi:hypothetical protein